MALVAAAALLLSASCRRDMFDRLPKRPLGLSPYFADRNASRPRVADTVARNEAVSDELLENGTIAGSEANAAPFRITVADVRRGHEEFDIYCSPCHGVLGDARGMVVRRGFPPPPSFHSPRLKSAPIGHYVHVIANGFGVMYSYGDRVEPRERWEIAAYIRALQLSQDWRGQAMGSAQTAAQRVAPKVSR